MKTETQTNMDGTSSATGVVRATDVGRTPGAIVLKTVIVMIEETRAMEELGTIDTRGAIMNMKNEGATGEGAMVGMTVTKAENDRAETNVCAETLVSMKLKMKESGAESLGELQALPFDTIETKTGQGSDRSLGAHPQPAEVMVGDTTLASVSGIEAETCDREVRLRGKRALV